MGEAKYEKELTYFAALMIYKAIGLMSGSSLDGLDIVYAHLQETGGKWNYEIVAADCYAYPSELVNRLKYAVDLPAMEYLLLDTDYGNYVGAQVNNFIDAYNLHHKVHLVTSHGHTSFHIPGKKMTAQLGDGAAIAAATGLPVVSDLRSLDIAFGGQGAPIVPIGQKLLFPDYDLFLNIGGIANISCKKDDDYIAFDVCPANRVLNILVEEKNMQYDEEGKIAASGQVDITLLNKLNELDYYNQSPPKSLSNSFGTEIVLPLIHQQGISLADALRTYVEHIVMQIKRAIHSLLTIPPFKGGQGGFNHSLLITGGGALNTFLISCLQKELSRLSIEVIVPEKSIIQYKEALIMALIGVLRWREEYNVLATGTGASRSSIGGALWIGTEA
jgi:anhydro-N-acetylmuramic acid kinase